MSPQMKDAIERMKQARTGLVLAVAAMSAAAPEEETMKIVVSKDDHHKRNCPITGQPCPVDAKTTARSLHRALTEATDRLSRVIENGNGSSPAPV